MKAHYSSFNMGSLLISKETKNVTITSTRGTTERDQALNIPHRRTVLRRTSLL